MEIWRNDVKRELLKWVIWVLFGVCPLTCSDWFCSCLARMHFMRASASHAALANFGHFWSMLAHAVGKESSSQP